MPGNHLPDDAVAYVVNGESSGVRLDSRVKHHMQENVPQFLLQKRCIVQINGLAGLIDFFYEVPPDALMGLHTVPGTAVRRTENPNERNQIVKVIMCFFGKECHGIVLCDVD